jgi:hypothetical protein
MANPNTVTFVGIGQTAPVANTPLNLGNLAAYISGAIMAVQFNWYVPGGAGAVVIPNRIRIQLGNVVGPNLSVFSLLAPGPFGMSPVYKLNTPFPSGLIIPSASSILWANAVHTPNTHILVNLTVYPP